MQTKRNILFRILRRVYRQFFQPVLFLLDYYDAKFFHHKNILAEYVIKKTSLKKNLCIFSHFDEKNIVDPYVIYYLKEFAKADCDIIFVSTSTSLPTTQREKIEPYCKKILLIANRGRDFAAFKAGLSAEKNLAAYQKVIIANDSVYGPFFDLSSVLQYGDDKQLDMWGVTDSAQHEYHIQSYFVVFGKSLISTGAFKTFWQNVHCLKKRTNIIYRYEIGMSRFFIKKGFKLGAYCDYETIRTDLFDLKKPTKAVVTSHKNYQYFLENKLTLNPTHYLWDEMITEYHYPFIKRELIMHNPEEMIIHHWTDLIKEHTEYDTHLIVKHLERLRNKS